MSQLHRACGQKTNHKKRSQIVDERKCCIPLQSQNNIQTEFLLLLRDALSPFTHCRMKLQITASVAPEIKEKIQDMAKEQNRSEAYIIENLLQDALKKYK